MDFWTTYRQRIVLLGLVLFLIWIPAFLVAWGVEAGTVPETLAPMAVGLAQAVVNVLGFPVVWVMDVLMPEGDVSNYLGRMGRAVGYGLGYLANALLFALAICWGLYRFSPRPPS